ncbi:VWA domain-containing protein [Legionella septentrionalis]|nr:VWA domain-containing protein [Legionella septentrionalis]
MENLMKNLVNNQLRSANMQQLLQAMNLDLNGVDVVCQDERVILCTTKNIKKLAVDMQNLLQVNMVKYNVKQVTLAELIENEIKQASGKNLLTHEINKQSCLAIFNLLKASLQYNLNKEKEYFEINLPEPVYADLFETLEYKYISVDSGKIKFNIKEFLNQHKEELILIEGPSSHLFMHSDLFKNKQIFYAERKINEDKIAVTPYFLIPNALTPPEYHFVLDISESMHGNRLEVLKTSVMSFAKALFNFQPNAVINIIQFNDKIVKLGQYSKEQYNNLCLNVKAMQASGGTSLFKAVINQVAPLLTSRKQNNTIVFTDGENTLGNEAELKKTLQQQIETVKNLKLAAARNKFFIISLGAAQPEILNEVSQAFHSNVISTNTSDFMEALSDQGKLEAWAASRELFTVRLEISDNSDIEVKEYVRDMSGQFVSLDTMECEKTKSIHLTIMDSNGSVLLDDTRDFGSQSNAKAMPFGMFAMNKKSKEDTLLEERTFSYQ